MPQREHMNTLGTIFSSSLFDNRAPPGLALLTTFVGGMRQPELARLDENEIAELVQAEHSGPAGRDRACGIRAHQTLAARDTAIHARPPSRIAAIEAVERRFPGVFFCANYRGGVAIGDCIKSADNTANQIAEFLRNG